MKEQYEVCPNCKSKSLYLANDWFFVCEECDEHFYIEEFIEQELELYDEFGDKIIY